MADKMLPKDIFNYLNGKVLGQEEVLKTISVVVYKHINDIRAGNVLIIGDSGTGKTTIMKSIQRFYEDHPELRTFRSMSIMNANVLRGEDEGDVNLARLFNNLEVDTRAVLGQDLSAEELQSHMEHATVCIDEVDKISARIAGKVNASGIAIQQALLTLLEGENVYHETTVEKNGRPERVKIPLNTGKMMFVCGGAFEELYDQVYKLVANKEDERRLKETAVHNRDGRIEYKVNFTLKEYLKLSDLFTYGMVPQFISRFSAIGTMSNLRQDVLKKIMLQAEDSPLRHSTDYFKTLGVELQLTENGLAALVDHAVKNTRIGARALREVFSRIITRYEFDPFNSDLLEEVDGGYKLVIDEPTVLNNLPGAR